MRSSPSAPEYGSTVGRWRREKRCWRLLKDVPWTSLRSGKTPSSLSPIPIACPPLCGVICLDQIRHRVKFPVPRRPSRPPGRSPNRLKQAMAARIRHSQKKATDIMTLRASNGRTLKGGLLGLLAGASLAALALGAPSHAISPNLPPVAAPGPVTTALAETPVSLADIVERVSPSVVQIMVRQTSPMQRIAAPGDVPGDLPPGLRDFFGRDFRFFFGEPGTPRQSPDRLGSGSGLAFYPVRNGVFTMPTETIVVVTGDRPRVRSVYAGLGLGRRSDAKIAEAALAE